MIFRQIKKKTLTHSFLNCKPQRSTKIIKQMIGAHLIMVVHTRLLSSNEINRKYMITALMNGINLGPTYFTYLMKQTIYIAMCSLRKLFIYFRWKSSQWKKISPKTYICYYSEFDELHSGFKTFGRKLLWKALQLDYLQISNETTSSASRGILISKK